MIALRKEIEFSNNASDFETPRGIYNQKLKSVRIGSKSEFVLADYCDSSDRGYTMGFLKTGVSP